MIGPDDMLHGSRHREGSRGAFEIEKELSIGILGTESMGHD